LTKSFPKNQGIFLSFGFIFFQKHSPGQASSLDIKRFKKKEVLQLVYGQMWLNLLVDDHQCSNSTKLKKQETLVTVLASRTTPI
jgi:hypothetical protein